MALYFGKFSDRHPDQIEGKYYSAGEEGNEWYGGIKPDDYVFPIYQGKIFGLWRVREYGQIQDKVTGESRGAVMFNEVKTYSKALRLSDEFTRYKYFDLDLNLVNKTAKSVKKCGFLPITIATNCPSPEAIEFTNNLRNFYICLSGVVFKFQEDDIRLAIIKNEDYKIASIDIYKDGKFVPYEPLLQLYYLRNPENERYTLNQLISFAIEDGAPNKKAYLNAVIKELDEKGYYLELSPIRLYDNIIVGRKRSAPSKVEGGDDGIDTADTESLDKYDEPDLAKFDTYADLLDFNPNLIMYGPPGTGKTYSAIKLIESYDKRITGIYKPFADIDSEGRVKFVTFHQAYSYEEFIEGIRPRLDISEGTDNSDESGQIGYRIEDGILKQIATTAAMQRSKISFRKPDELKNLTPQSSVWKVSLGRRSDDTIFKQCINSGEIAMGWLENDDLTGYDSNQIMEGMKSYYKEHNLDVSSTQAAGIVDSMVNGLQIGDLVLIYNSPNTVRAVGIVDGGYFYSSKNVDSYPHRRKVKWLKVCENGQELDIFDLNGQIKLTLKTIYQLTRISVHDILNLIEDKKQTQNNKVINALPYYLIIDEINRGNIARIFGELITLIEKDKRDLLSCYLPYSKKKFSLPSNLYIIGTMNTADKSIAILDTALRRRFVFVEVEPDLRVFDDPDIVPSPLVNGTIELSKLLGKLNERLSVMIDRDHRIGHSYFLNINSIGDLYKRWYYNIIPLVMEYFYNNPESVRKVIGEKFVDLKGNVIILSTHSEEGQYSAFEEAILMAINSKD